MMDSRLSAHTASGRTAAGKGVLCLSDRWLNGRRCPLWVITGQFAMREPCPRYLRKRKLSGSHRMSAKGQKQTLACYSITSSALASREDGKVSPSNLALLMAG